MSETPKLEDRRCPYCGCNFTPQTPEQRYCEALSDLYMRYVGNPETEPRNVRRNDADAEAALAQCRHGEPVVSIPVLERKLVDNIVDGLKFHS